MVNIKEIVEKIIGKKKGKDTDMDGVIDKKDCQPKNPMKQDTFTAQNFGRVVQNVSQIRGIQTMDSPNVKEFRQRVQGKIY